MVEISIRALDAFLALLGAVRSFKIPKVMAPAPRQSARPAHLWRVGQARTEREQNLSPGYHGQAPRLARADDRLPRHQGSRCLPENPAFAVRWPTQLCDRRSCQLFDARNFHNRKLLWNALYNFRHERREMLGLEVSLDGCLIRPAFNQDIRLWRVRPVPFVPQTSLILGDRVRSNFSRKRLKCLSIPAFTRWVTTMSNIATSTVGYN